MLVSVGRSVLRRLSRRDSGEPFLSRRLLSLRSNSFFQRTLLISEEVFLSRV